MSKRIDVKNLDIYYGDFLAVKDVSVTIEPRSVTALIGPSGCGKSTVLRTLNRMHEVIPGARVEGEVLIDGVRVDPLTPREADVLEFAADGAPVEQIARRAHLAPGTVRNYLSEAIGKLGVGNRIEAYRLARSIMAGELAGRLEAGGFVLTHALLIALLYVPLFSLAWTALL